MSKQYLFIRNPEQKPCKLYIKEQIAKWINSKELEDVVLAFGGQAPQKLDLKDKVTWLLNFSNVWDYRNQKNLAKNNENKKERWQINKQTFSESQNKAVFNSVFSLGLSGIEIPYKKEFDYVLILGGARYSCLYRTQYVKYLLDNNLINTEKIVLLSSMRSILGEERKITDEYAPGAETEYDLMNKGIERAFRLKEDYCEKRYYNENPNLNWATRKYVQNELQITSFAAPSSEPNKRRTNTVDTYNFFLENERIAKKSSLLLVTSQIYVPYQQMEGIRVLGDPYDLYMETVGFPTNWSKKLNGMMETENYLQEIRSVIQSVGRYLKV